MALQFNPFTGTFDVTTKGDTGNVSAAGDGTAAAPGISFASDTNTGIYRPGADQLALSTNGTGRLFVDAGGNIGVGMTPVDVAGFNSVQLSDSNGTYLDFYTGATQQARIISLPNDFRINQITSGTLGLWTNNTERLRITATGELLHIGGGTAGTPAVYFSGSAPSNSLYVAATTGQVGIGNTTGLGGTLGVSGNISLSGAGTGPRYLGLLYETSTYAGSYILQAGGGSAGFGGAITMYGHSHATYPGSVYIGTSTSSGGKVYIGTNNALDPASTRMTVTTTGVGIGNNAPNRRLEISDLNADNFIRVNTSGAFKSGIEFSNLGTAFGQLYFNNVAPYDLSLLQQYTTGSLILGTNNTERARIDSSGRLLVGTTTSEGSFFNSSGVNCRAEIQSQFYLQSWVSNNAGNSSGAHLIVARSRGSTPGSKTLVQNDDNIGLLSFQGADGSEFVEAAKIDAFVDGTPGANDMPGRLVFSTTADGAASPTERLRITNDGVCGYNQPAPVAVDATATLTVANLKTGIITSTTAAAVTMTLPTGTLTEGGFSGLYTNFTFEWTVINTGATNAVTVQGDTGHTLVGSGTVAAGVSGRFASRRTAANTFVTYRLS